MNYEVHISGELEPLIPGYLENRKKDIEAFTKALANEDFERIASMGHKMKGSGGGYGFVDLSRIGRGIEKAGREKDLDAARKSVDTLKEYLENVEIIFD